MGGGEWINTRQMEQQQSLERAYKDMEPVQTTHVVEKVEKIETPEIHAEVRTEIRQSDGIDQAYVWARTFTPSWVMGIIFLAGIFAVIPTFLKKFGINISVKKQEKEK